MIPSARVAGGTTGAEMFPAGCTARAPICARNAETQLFAALVRTGDSSTIN